MRFCCRTALMPKIAGDEPMTALHQIQHAFGFADAALSREKQADAENVCQRPVKGDGRRELHLQHGLDAAIELRGLELGADNRYAGVAGNLLESGGQPLALGHEDGGDRKREKELEDFLSFASRKRGEVSDLGLPEHLKAFGREAFYVTG